MAAALTTEFLCNLLIKQGLMNEDQKRTALVKESTQRSRILQGQTGRLAGRQGARYEVLSTEVIASFGFSIPGKAGQVLDEDHIAQALSQQSGYPYRKLDPLKLDVALVTQTLSRPFARRHAVIPIARMDNELVVAIANPYDLETIEGIRRLTGCQIKPVVSAKGDILKIITELYGFRTSVSAAEQDFTAGIDIGNLEQFVRLKTMDEIEATDKHVVNAVEYLLHYAFDQRASDIHIEPKRDRGLIRMRIDGVLHNIYSVPKLVHPAMVSRLKTLARLDIAEKRKPQDGRIKTEQNGREVELRISTMPVAFGEKIVIRIFDPDVLMQELGSLGLFERELAQVESSLSHPHGMILVTGPTGSGKTTTLYSALKVLATDEVNVVSIEDPIEMVYEQFNQVAIQPRAGITFTSALRTVLRQDPDIVMVGEIRDRETAEHCIQAALTGHLVLSTLHTNDTAGAVSRLLELGVEPFLISSTLIAVVAQRLARTICDACKQESMLTPEEISVLGIHIPEGRPRQLKVQTGEGCPRCRGTGLRNRTGVFEVLEVTDKVRRLIHRRADSAEIMRVARQDGMKTLREQAIRKLAQGLTSFQEVLRITGDLN